MLINPTSEQLNVIYLVKLYKIFQLVVSPKKKSKKAIYFIFELKIEI